MIVPNKETAHIPPIAVPRKNPIPGPFLRCNHPSLVTPMPTPPQSYSAAAAEKLRLALLALAASATVVASAQDTDTDADFDDPDVLGEIPEDIETGGDYGDIACPKKGCKSEDCWCDDDCVEEKPCTACDTQSGDGKEKTHAENAEGAESQSHAENAEGAEARTHAENAESAEAKTHAESAEGAESGEGSGEAESSPSVAPAAATNAVQELARAMSEKSGYPVSADLVVAAAKRLNQDPEEYAKKTLEEIGGAAASTNAPSSAPSDRILVLGRRR